MKDISRVCFIVSARLGSERTPRKMLRPFGDTTLIDISLETIKKTKIPIDQFWLSVYEPELIEVGHKHGVQVFERSEASAQSDDDPGLIHEYHKVLDFDFCVLISACHPFLSAATIDQFVDEYLQAEKSGMMAVVGRQNFFWEKDGTRFGTADKTCLNTKRVEPMLEGANCLYGSAFETLRVENKFMGDMPQIFEVENPWEAWDIDWPWQFDMAEAAWKAGLFRP